MAFDRAIAGNLYPFNSHFLDRNGIKLHYLDEGKGDPVVCVHGNPTWSFYYREVVKAFRGTHRVIVPDHVGCGLSDKPGDDRYEYTLDSRVADLEALLEHLGVRERVTLVLHDWGGMIGMAWATRHPERVARLVILNTSAFLLPETKRLPFTLRLVRDVTPFGALAVRGFNAFSYMATFMAAKRPMSEEVRQALTAPYDSWKNRIATFRFVQDIPLAPGDRAYATVVGVQDGLAKLRHVPMLIAWGEKDFVFDDHFLREWKRRFPEADVHTFPEAGHYVLEDAHAGVVGLVRDFFQKNELPAREGAPAPA